MRKVYLFLFLAALIFTLVMAWLPHPPAVPGNPNDKLQHTAAFVTLSVLGSLAFPDMPLSWLGERLSFLGAIIEVVQNIPSLHRDCDVMDWLADTVAVILALAIVWFMRQKYIRRSVARASDVIR